MPIAHLSQRAVLGIRGGDAAAFLQGLITNDIALLARGAPLYAGLLSPQGKALFSFILFAGDDGGLLLDCAAEQADVLAKRLAMFRLRRDVTIERTGLAVFAGWGEASEHPRDPRHPAAGARWIAASAAETGSLADWHAHRIPLGLPEADEIGSDELLWLEANGRELNGVSFTKGCYVGQENTARMHHRGKVRKALVGARIAGTPAGTVVRAGTKEAGQLRGKPCGDLQMLLIRTEFLDAELVSDAGPVTLIRPHWLQA
jgi:folate-binding protein YgfZ